METGRTLTVQGVDSSNQPLTGTFPLAGFAEAYDGPSSKPQIFEMQQKDLQVELERRRKAAGEVRKPEGC